MINKNYIFSSEIKIKNLKVYLLSLGLSIWGIGNIFYWEIYKGNSACTICKWHRVAYIALLILLLLLFKYKRSMLKLFIWIALILEILVSMVQIMGFCSPLVCRHVSLVDKLNFGFAIGTLVLIFLFELRSYLKHQKYLNLKVKHVDHSSNFKVSR